MSQIQISGFRRADAPLTITVFCERCGEMIHSTTFGRDVQRDEVLRFADKEGQIAAHARLRHRCKEGAG